jgi:acyl dehydratase
MATMHVSLERIGRWTDETRFQVTEDRVRAFAAATNDDHPLYARGVLAPPLFAVVPVSEHVARALDGMVDAADRRWGLHAGQDMRFYRPIGPGMVLRTRAVPIGVQARPLGAMVIIKAESRADDGELLVEQYVTLLFRRKLNGPGSGEDAPDHRLPAAFKASARSEGRVLTVTHAVDPDQTYRYADASGDRNPIHLDPEFARSVGLPGIIVHGMCTMAFASRAVVQTVCEDDPRRLVRLAVRFARPVFPGQTITTHIWPAGQRDARSQFGFETLNPEGKAVLADGLGEVDVTLR